MSLDMPRSERSVDQYFDGEATRWIRRYRDDPAFQTRLTTIGPVVIRATLESDSGRVLDFGGGAGVFSAIASTHATMVLNLDRSTEMLLTGLQHPEELSRLAWLVRGRYRPKHVHRVAGDLGTLGKSARDFFDVILAISVLEYIDDVPAVIHYLADLLKPGGKMILQVPNRHSVWRYSRAALSRADLITRAVCPFRRKSPGSWMALRPHGDRLPWRVALSAAGMGIIGVERVAHGPERPLRWFHPNLLIIATKPKSSG